MGSNNEVLKEFKKKNKSFMLRFTAKWCTSCKMIDNSMGVLLDEGVPILTLDIDDDKNAETANEFNVLTLPTVLIWKDGDVVESLVGAKGLNIYEGAWEKHTGEKLSQE